MFHLVRTNNSDTIFEIQDNSGTAVFQVRGLAASYDGKFQLVAQSGIPLLGSTPLPNAADLGTKPIFEFKKNGELVLTVVRPFGGSRLECSGPKGELVLDSDELRKPGKQGPLSSLNNNEISWKIRDAEFNRCGYIRCVDEGAETYSIEVVGEADLYTMLGLAVLLAENLAMSKVVHYD
jgi:hypothetical protein